MKKYLLIALAAALLLSGCGQTAVQTEPTTLPTEPSVETTVPTEPLPTYYVENSETERGTAGAVKLYELEGRINGMTMLGGNILICESGRKFHLVDPVTMKILKTRELDTILSWTDESLVITENGVAYYAPASRTYVTLDTNLLIVSTYVIDADMETRPVISNSFEKICYGTEEGLEVMILADGTARRIREEQQTIVSVDGLLFDDSVICYTRQNQEGAEQVYFVNAEDGSLLDAASLSGRLHALGQRVVCVTDLEHAFGQDRWLITGQWGSPLQRLDTQFAWDDALILHDGRAVLQDLTAVGVSLYCYDLESGILLAQTMMPGQTELLKLGGGDGDRIWLSDGTDEKLYCWDTTVASRGGTESELTGYASLSSGDEAGMEQVLRLAEIIGDKFAVDITFTEENNRTNGVNYDRYADQRPAQYNRALEELKLILEKLPVQLFQALGKGAASGRIQICLVDGYDPETGATEATGSIDVTDGGLKIRVNMCADLQKIFCHELFHLMEVRIRTLTDGFKNWTDCNPQGFDYLNSFEPVESGAMNASAYLQLGSNYFADAYGMVSAREDRAQVFLYAMQSGEQTRFESDTMQEKLTQISQMLRKCFKLDEDLTPTWEQYLKSAE